MYAGTWLFSVPVCNLVYKVLTPLSLHMCVKEGTFSSCVDELRGDKKGRTVPVPPSLTDMYA